MKRILIGTVAMIMAMPAFAVPTLSGDPIPIVINFADKTTTSKPYVDAQIETTQVKIPAAGAQGVGDGTSVITYTGTAGKIGERALYTGGNYTWGDARKLITASALNDRFTNLPTTGTTKLQCANQNDGCTLWTIVDQTAYGVSGEGTTTIDLTALVNATATGSCYKNLQKGTVSVGTCTEAPPWYGDWGVTFDVNGETVQVNGISACSTVNANSGISTNQSGVQADYESNMAAAPTSSPVGSKCYCKANDSAAGWVYYGQFYDSTCARNCASNCANSVRNGSNFRGTVFGVN